MQLSSKVQELLNITISRVSTQQIWEAIKQLRVAANNNEYISILIDIALKKTSKKQLIRAALNQIKDAVSSELMNIENQVADLNSIHHRKLYQVTKMFLPVVRLHSSNHQYSKLVKDITGQLSKGCLQNANVIYQSIKNEKEVTSSLKYMLSAYQSTTLKIEEVRKIFKMVIDLLPDIAERTLMHLQSLYRQNKQQQEEKQTNLTFQWVLHEELIYLLIKFAYKSLLSQASDYDQMYFAYSWARIALKRLNTYSCIFDSNRFSKAQLGSAQYSYFHGKKWAMKFMTKFVKFSQFMKKIKKIESLQADISYSLKIYLSKLFTHLQSEYILSWKLLFFNAILLNRRDLILQNISQFLKQYLPSIILRRDQDDFLLYPKDHFNKEFSSISINIKKMVCQVWIKCLLFGSSTKQKINGSILLVPGNKFQQSLEILEGWINGNENKLVQLGICILCNMPQDIKKNHKIQRLIFQFMPKALNIFLYSNVQSLRSRVLSFIKHNGQFIPKSFLSKAKKYVQDLIISTSKSYQKMLGIAALQGIAKTGKSLLQDQSPISIKLVFSIITRYIQEYKIEQLMVSLNILVDIYAYQLKQYALFVINEANNFIFLAQKSNKQKLPRQNVQFLRDGAMKMIESMMIHIEWKNQTSFNMTTDNKARSLRNEIEKKIVRSIEQMFLTQSFHTSLQQYKQTLLIFSRYINAHRVKKAQLTSLVKELFRIFLCRISTLTKRQIFQAQDYIFSSKQRQIIKRCLTRYQQFYQVYYQVIRSYIQALPLSFQTIRNIDLVFENIFAANDIQFLFCTLYHAFYTIKFGNIQNEGNLIKGRILTLNLLIALYQNHGPFLSSGVHQLTYKIIVFNINANIFTTQMLSNVNAELFGIWLYSKRASDNINFIYYGYGLHLYIKHFIEVRYVAESLLEKGHCSIKKINQPRSIRRILLALINLIDIFFGYRQTVQLFSAYLKLALYFAEKSASFNNKFIENVQQERFPHQPPFYLDKKARSFQATPTPSRKNQNNIAPFVFESDIDAVFRQQFNIISCSSQKLEDRISKDKLSAFKIDDNDPNYQTMLNKLNLNLMLMQTIQKLKLRQTNYWRLHCLIPYQDKINKIINSLDQNGLAFKKLTI